MNETITEINDPENELKVTEIEVEKRVHYFQIDFMKMIMIALVIVDHSFTHGFLHDYYSPFWERISIPLLMVIMGFNMGYSYKNKGKMTFRQMYSIEYFKNKFKRYLIPYVVLYTIQSFIYLIVLNGGITTIPNDPYDAFDQIYLGYSPFWGPGMWFIPVIVTSILIFPLLYKCYSANKISRIVTFVACFGIEIGMQLIQTYIIPQYHITGSFFGTHILYMFSAVALGLWLSDDHRILSKRNIIYWVLFPVSVVYLYLYYTIGWSAASETFYMEYLTGDYHMLTFPYSAFLFLIGMALLPKNPKGRISNFVRRISKSTYHILMAQILYFSIVYHFFLQMFDYGAYPGPFIFDGTPMNYLWYFPMNLIITFTIGLFWYELDRRFFAKSRENKILKMWYYLLMTMAVAFFLIRFITQFYFFAVFPF